MFPPPESSRTVVTGEAEYSPQERGALLRLAHQSIESALARRDLDLTPPSEHLAEHRGAFTTLHLRGKLRGCIGYVFPNQSLYRTVAETARAAAFDDPRFEPVQAAEAPELMIEISVLSPLRPASPEDVVVGKHGLVVQQGSRRRTAAAAGAGRVGVGPRDLPRPNLPEGGTASGCLDARGGTAGVHGGSVRRGIGVTNTDRHWQD